MVAFITKMIIMCAVVINNRRDNSMLLYSIKYKFDVESAHNGLSKASKGVDNLSLRLNSSGLEVIEPIKQLFLRHIKKLEKANIRIDLIEVEPNVASAIATFMRIAPLPLKFKALYLIKLNCQAIYSVLKALPRIEFLTLNTLLTGWSDDLTALLAKTSIHTLGLTNVEYTTLINLLNTLPSNIKTLSVLDYETLRVAISILKQKNVIGEVTSIELNFNPNMSEEEKTALLANSRAEVRADCKVIFNFPPVRLRNTLANATDITQIPQIPQDPKNLQHPQNIAPKIAATAEPAIIMATQKVSETQYLSRTRPSQSPLVFDYSLSAAQAIEEKYQVILAKQDNQKLHLKAMLSAENEQTEQLREELTKLKRRRLPSYIRDDDTIQKTAKTSIKPSVKPPDMNHLISAAFTACAPHVKLAETQPDKTNDANITASNFRK